MSTATKTFRKTFSYPGKINWFPGHMNFSFKQMQAKMRSVDCVFEVHDARIPFSGRNPLFLKTLVGTKPHVLVLNKVDLIDPTSQRLIEERVLENNCENLVFTNCVDHRNIGLKSIVPLAKSLIQKSLILPSEKTRHNMMVVGVPNVGKSSFINALRNLILSRGKATSVGPNAGVTRSVKNEIKVCEEPPIYLIDTPGILVPNISDIESGMKLALCSCIKDEVVGTVKMADFLLYWMNKTENFKYVEYFNLQKPTDEILPLLLKIALDENKMIKLKNIVKNSLELVPNVQYAAQKLVNHFRKGKLGDLYFDKEYLKC